MAAPASCIVFGKRSRMSCVIGRYVVNAISRRDLPAIQGTVLFLSTVFVLVNLITDLAYAKADPRVSYR